MIEKVPDKTEYIANDLGETKPKILIGGMDSVVGSKFVPNVNFSFECFSGAERYFINLNRKDLVITTQKETFNDNKISFEVDGVINEFYTDTSYKTENFTWDLKIPSKPLSNILEWEIICSPQLSFFYQPALTETEIDEGHRRPDHIIGSYAVYCDSAENIRKIDGTPRLKCFTGKLCHIYRPKFVDSVGKSAWGELFIDPATKTFRITIPQVFLNSAVYPLVTGESTVKLGYDSAGLTEHGAQYKMVSNYSVQATSDGTPYQIAVYTGDAAYLECKCCVYDGTSAGNRLSDSYTLAGTDYDSWAYKDLTGDAMTVSSGVNYHVSMVQAGGWEFCYDSGNAGDSYYTTSLTWATEMVDPCQSMLSNDIRGSIYFEYTEAAGGDLTKSVSEKIAITESRTLSLPLVGISVSEKIAIIEETIRSLASPSLTTSVSEKIAATEVLTTALPLGLVSVLEKLALVDVPTLSLPLPGVSLSEKVAITEFLEKDLPLGLVSVSDQLALTEVLTITLPLIGLSVAEKIAIGEVIGKALQGADLSVDVKDKLAVAEALTFSLPLAGVSVVEQIAVSESVAVNVPLAGISVEDKVAITEVLSSVLPLPGVSVAEDIAIVESAIGNLPPAGISVVEKIAITEDPNVSFIGTVNLSADLAEILGVSEEATLSLGRRELTLRGVIVGGNIIILKGYY